VSKQIIILHVSSAGEDKKAEESTETKNNLPKNVRLRSTLLINIRTSVGIQVIKITSLSFYLFIIYFLMMILSNNK
jgi:hypothetical protein